MAILIRRGIVPPVAVGGATPAYSNNGNTLLIDGVGLTTTDFTFSIGNAAADRLVIVGVGVSAGGTVDGVTVDPAGANVALDLQKSNVDAIGRRQYIFSKLVTSGSGSKTIRVTTSTGLIIGTMVWKATGLNSNSAKQTGSFEGAINNTGDIDTSNVLGGIGDFLFIMSTANNDGSNNYSGSEETVNTYTDVLVTRFAAGDVASTIATATWTFNNNVGAGSGHAMVSYR